MKKLRFQTRLLIVFILFSLSVSAQNDSFKIDSLKKVLSTEKDDTNRINTLNELSGVTGDGSDYINAMKYANQALTLAQKLSFKKGESKTYINFGNIYYYQSNYAEALKNYYGGLKLLEETGNKISVANTLERIADIYSYQNNFVQALKNENEALRLYKELDEKQNIADAHKTLADIHLSDGNYINALKDNQDALDLYKKLGDTIGSGWALMQRADIYVQQGKYGEALIIDSAALKLFKAANSKDFITVPIVNIGLIYQKQGDIALSKGDSIAMKTRYLEALNYFLVSLRLTRDSSSKGSLSSIYWFIGNIYLKLKNFPAAKRFLNTSIQLTKAIRNIPALVMAYKALVTVDSAQGNINAAYDNYRLTRWRS